MLFFRLRSATQALVFFLAAFHLQQQIMRFHPLYFLFCLSLLNYINHGLSTCSLTSSIPIYLPIKNVTLSEQVQKRGIALSVGTPEQTLAFQVSVAFDDIYLFSNLNGCSTPETDSTTLLACSATIGGIWDKERSSSWLQASISPDNFDEFTGTETIRIGSSSPLSNFPITITSTFFTASNFVGFGRNSTFLNRLSSARLIASRSWGYYQGWTGAEIQYQFDGSLVLGGYDEAKTIGENSSFPFGDAESCGSGFSFTVSDIKMNFVNGTDVSIIGSSPGAAMNACLSFSYPLLALPADMWDSFVQFSGVSFLGRASGFHDEAMLISGDRSYDGDLTVTLSFGLEIRIPNHQLVVPDYHRNSQGELQINGSDRVVLVNSVHDRDKATYLPTFGQVFLSSAYILINDDIKQFTVWKSNPTTAKNLLAVGEGCESIASSSRLPLPTSVLISPSASISPSALTPTDTELQNPKSNRRMGNGTITGIIIGGITCIFLSCGAILMIRGKRNIISQNGLGANESRLTQQFNHGIFYNKSELPADRHPPQEMLADPQSPREMLADPQFPQEMPAYLRPQEMPVAQHLPSS